MRYVVAIFVCLIASFSVLAQDAHSPQEFATQIKSLMETDNTNSIAQLVHSSAEPASVERLKSTLSTYASVVLRS